MKERDPREHSHFPFGDTSTETMPREWPVRLWMCLILSLSTRHTFTSGDSDPWPIAPDTMKSKSSPFSFIGSGSFSAVSSSGFSSSCFSSSLSARCWPQAQALQWWEWLKWRIQSWWIQDTRCALSRIKSHQKLQKQILFTFQLAKWIFGFDRLTK